MSAPRRLDQFPAYGGADPSGLIYYFLNGRAYQVPFSQLTSAYTPLAYGAVGDGTIDDTDAIQAAFDDVPVGGVLSLSGRTWVIKQSIRLLGRSDVTVDWTGAQFRIFDTMTPVSFTNNGTTTGKIGFLFDECDSLTLLGAARFLGQGVAGTTTLTGVVFNDCDDLQCPQDQFFSTMALGRYCAHLNRPALGNALCLSMNGMAPFGGGGNAGDGEVLDGCQFGRTGDVVAINNAKAVRYMSVGSGRNNVGMKLGASICEGNGSSATATALSIRAAVDCAFGPVITRDAAAGGLFAINYSGDQAAGYGVDRVYIEAVLGEPGPTAADVDSLVSCNSEDAAGLGSITIGTVAGNILGEYGIINNAADLEIVAARLKGSAPNLIATYATPRTALATTSPYYPKTHIHRYEQGVHTGAGKPVVVGKQGKFTCGSVLITDGPASVSASAFCHYDSSYGPSAAASHLGIHLGDIEYIRNSSAQNYTNLLYDSSATAGPALTSIRNVIKSDAGGADMLLSATDYYCQQGRWLSAAIPTNGVFPLGFEVGRRTPASGQPQGWSCSVAGTIGSGGTFIPKPNYP